jgi:hypothetical protein
MNQLKPEAQELKSAQLEMAVDEESDATRWDLGLFLGFVLWLVIVGIGYWGYKSGLLLLGA